jgi:hypothetical protein
MRIAKNDIHVRIDAPGAVARQQTNFGDASGCGKISGEYFSLGAGGDISPLLKGLEGRPLPISALGLPIAGRAYRHLRRRNRGSGPDWRPRRALE